MRYNRCMFLKLLTSFVRFLGLVSILASAAVFFFFGRDFMPLFEDLLLGGVDVFLAYITLSTFFFGIPALLWVGFRLLYLRSFSAAWLTYLALPITAGLMLAYDIDTIFSMDRLLSLSVVYLLTYFIVRFVLMYLHEHLYTPISHEGLRHVGVEKTNKPPKRYLLRILLVILLILLLIAHPADIATTLRMLVSPITQLIKTAINYF